MRRALITLFLLAVAAVPTAAVAQLPAPPPLPPLPPLPTVPLPAPVPPPTAPLPKLPAAPAPAPPAAPQPPAVPAPALPAAPQPPAVSGATGSPSTPALPAGSKPSAGSGPAAGGRPTVGSGPTTSGATPTSGRSSRATGPKRRPSVVLAFRVPSSGRVAIRLRQIAPVCRSAGRLLVPAQNGANRFRFNGRVSGRPLHDGTYVAKTPSGAVRFAMVKGKPTRNTRKLAPSVCDSGVLGASAWLGAASRTGAASAANIDRDAIVEPGPIPQVLGRAFTEVAEATASLNPAFFLVLGLAMVALAAAMLPARVLPVATAGAVLARNRAALTLAGTLSLLLVIVVYWVTQL
jgi:hypothetical protein